MKKSNKFTRAIHRTGLKIKKHSPEILMAIGITGVVTTCVVACKSTTKASEILNEHKANVESVHEAAQNPQFAETYSEKDKQKDLTIVYTQTGLKFVKLYAPSVALGVVSIGCILASNNIIRKRNIALSAAYAAVDSNFKKYRERVIDRFDEALDKELRYGIKAKEIEETVIDEDGNEKTVKSIVNVIEDPTKYGEFAVIFDEFCPGWTDDATYNKMFLVKQQNYANEILKAKGHLFLNEVHDMLGIPRTKAGQIVGWVYDEETPVGDNFVDFGIFDTEKERVRAFINGYEKSIILDFNCDGNILDLI